MSIINKISQAAFNEGVEKGRRVVAETQARELAAENARLVAAAAAPPSAPPVPVAPAPPVDPLVAINAVRNPLVRSVLRAQHHLSKETELRLAGGKR